MKFYYLVTKKFDEIRIFTTIDGTRLDSTTLYNINRIKKESKGGV